MSYLIISFSHKNTDIQMREKLAFNEEEQRDDFLKQLLQNQNTKEVVLLSTCNRVEIITRSIDIKDSSNDIIKKLSLYSDLNFDVLYDRADIYDNEGAVHHIFSVASALDSLVIGETQIVGQLKDAFRFSTSQEYCGLKISRLIHFAFKCAASVRNTTSLGTGSVSVASTAVTKAKDIIGDTHGVKALVVGAGEMAELTIKHLISTGFDVVLINRNINNARDLSNIFETHIYVEAYENLTKLLKEIPVVITATSSPKPIITKENVSNSSLNRYWFDISVPRNIDNIQMDTLSIFSVDDLQEIVNENMSLRAEQAKTAYSIVSKMSIEFFDCLKSLEVEPIIKNLYLRGENIIDKKVSDAIKKGYISVKDEENIRKLCQTIITEYLHKPSTELKNISKNINGDLLIDMFQNIFEVNNSFNKKNN